MRILLIEDDQQVSRFIKRGLEEATFAVDVVRSGAAGVEMAQTYTYDIIILELTPPDMPGIDLLRQIRRLNAQTPILVLAERGGISDKVESLENGADDYLTKPIAFVELLVRIKVLLRRGSGARDSVVQVADLELDRLAQRVRRAGRRIELTKKEYALLEYLMSNVGRVLSRTMIIEHVWDQNFNGVTNIVDVYIRHLRVKLDESHPRKLIRTVRGMGYMIAAEDQET